MDFLTGLRLKSLFDSLAGNGGPETTFPGMSGPMDMGYQPPPMTMMGNQDDPMMGWQPETASIDKYNQMIGQYPQFKEPGKLKKLGAIALGSTADLFGQGGGQKAFGEMLYGKHNRAVADWKNQIEPLERSANIERQTNANTRTNIYQQAALKLRQEQQDAKESNDAKKAQIAQQRADVYEFRARNPNMRIVIPKGGNIMAINPQTGEPMDTGIPSGSLTDLDRINLTQANAMERIEKQQEGASNLVDKRNVFAKTFEDLKQKNRIEVKTTVPGKADTGTGGVTPSQNKVGQYNKARELVNSRPELAKWIKLGTNNDFTVSPPSAGGMFDKAGPTQEQYNEINQFIYGNGAVQLGQRTNVPPPNTGSRGNPTPTKSAPMTKQVRNRNTGEVKEAYSYDGGKSWTFERR